MLAEQVQANAADECSDKAQLSSPFHFEGGNYDEEIPNFCSQSSISLECQSEISCHLDFFLNNGTTGPNTYGKLSPLIDQNVNSGSVAAQQPFTLSPLDEFDEEYENPLNKGMMIDSTATGFTWSKARGEVNASMKPGTMLLSAEGDLLVKDESVPDEHHNLDNIYVGLDSSGATRALNNL